MYQAELKGKLSGTNGEKEDILTSNVFSYLVLNNEDEKLNKTKDGKISGMIHKGPNKGEKYNAFQGLLNPSIESEGVAKVVEKEIIAP